MVVRFSRKTKENYVRSEVDGKPSGYTALYVDGNWEVTDKRKKPKSKINKQKAAMGCFFAIKRYFFTFSVI